MPRVITSHRNAYNDRPFAGEGVSVYAQLGTGPVTYRNLRLVGARRRRRKPIRIKGTGGVHDLAAASVLKTSRRTSAADPAVSQNWALPGSWIPAAGTQDVVFDVRRYADDVENESDNFRPRVVTIDTTGAGNDQILGTATLLDQTPLAGGIVRLRLAYQPHRDGIQPTVFRATRTAGPTIPADATVTVDAGTRLAEIDTPALSDAAPYTYTIRAENAAGTVTKDLLTGVSVTADATGPPAPISGSSRAV
ncbi:MAG: hypothetical protein KY476_00645 [Planctomycetes bacterium]|nr:hypothetical protein [Planctomycetota bacterium]